VENVRLSLTNYRAARAESTAFILLPGHDDPLVERIVARGDGYTSWSRNSPESSGARCIQVDRDVSGCAFLFHDDVILRALDDRLDLVKRVTLCNYEPG
jgi:hypothetical protein